MNHLCVCVLQTALKYEDGEIDDSSLHLRKERRKMAAGDQEGRKSRRTSSQNLPDLLSYSAGSSTSASPTPPTFLSPSTATNNPLSPAISSASSSSPTAGLGSRASSPLTSDPGSASSSPAGSQRGSPLPPHTAPNSATTTTTTPEEEAKTPISP